MVDVKTPLKTAVKTWMAYYALKAKAPPKDHSSSTLPKAYTKFKGKGRKSRTKKRSKTLY
jgi:hypothetical protein